MAQVVKCLPSKYETLSSKPQREGGWEEGKKGNTVLNWARMHSRPSSAPLISWGQFNNQSAGAMAQVVERLPSKCEALSLNPSAAPQKKKKKV
jgi:hypothetical protein